MTTVASLCPLSSFLFFSICLSFFISLLKVTISRILFGLTIFLIPFIFVPLHSSTSSMNQLARWMELVDVFCDVHLLLLPFTCLLGLPLQPLISLSLFNPMTNVLRLYFDLVIVSWTVWRGDIFLPPQFWTLWVGRVYVRKIWILLWWCRGLVLCHNPGFRTWLHVEDFGYS